MNLDELPADLRPIVLQYLQELILAERVVKVNALVSLMSVRSYWIWTPMSMRAHRQIQTEWFLLGCPFFSWNVSTWYDRRGSIYNLFNERASFGLRHVFSRTHPREAFLRHWA